jgi:CheY-like chemotaxis protein
VTQLTVLVVDDEPALLRVVGRALKSAGYRIIPASGGEEACEALRTERVDLVLIDLHMPGMSGETLFYAVRAEWPDLADRMIVMSGDLEGSQTGWLRAYAVPVLLKPFEVGQLLSLVAARLVAPRRANGAG